MLYGSQLDDALEHVDGSRYALVHAVSKRARQITLWLTADPAELRSEDAPPPAPGELSSRDPVALAEAEILSGEVDVRWNPDGSPEERELPDATVFEADPLLLELEDDARPQAPPRWWRPLRPWPPARLSRWRVRPTPASSTQTPPMPSSMRTLRSTSRPPTRSSTRRAMVRR